MNLKRKTHSKKSHKNEPAKKLTKKDAGKKMKRVKLADEGDGQQVDDGKEQTKGGETVAGKRKRPWRQAVRHRAKRERLTMAEEEDGRKQQLEEEGQQEELEKLIGKKKKKRRKTLEQAENRGEKEQKEVKEEGQHEELEKVAGKMKKKRRKAPKQVENKEEEQKEQADSTVVKTPAKRKKKSKVKRLRDKQRLMGESGDALENGLQPEQPPIVARMAASRFRYINECLYTQPSTSAAQMFEQDPNAFDAYHRGYREQIKKWPTNPLQTLILDLSSLPSGSVIADMGCGEAELARKLGDRLKVHSFDLVAANERVVAADMANLPLARSSVDVCVYCLSLMGTNLAHFFREAHRILKKDGKLKIAEVASRFQNVKSFIAALAKMGFQLKRKKEIGNGFFILMTLHKVGKIENKRPQGLQLLPCLYKKR